MMIESPSYRDEHRASYQVWAEANAEQLSESRKQYRIDNAERLSAYEKQRLADNPGLMEEKSYTRRRVNAGFPIMLVERVDPGVVFERDNGTCQICLTLVDQSILFPDPMSATLDHIIPVSHPASAHSYSNTQLAHWDCNRRKWNKVPAALRSLGELTP